MNEQERSVQVELAARGDQDALQRLIVLYHAQLSGILHDRITAAEQRHIDPDDVLQDAYAAAFRAITDCRFDGPGAFYKWLETIALNVLKNRQRDLRAQKRDAAREIHGSLDTTTSCPDLVHRLAAPESTPSRHVRREEAVGAVLSSMARLPDDQRDVIRLRFLEDRPVAEVAARLGKTEAAVHGLCRRGIRALRQSMVSISRFLTHL